MEYRQRDRATRILTLQAEILSELEAMLSDLDAGAKVGRNQLIKIQHGMLARIVSYRLEDDTADRTKGRVIVICEPVEPTTRPYRPQGMETK